MKRFGGHVAKYVGDGVLTYFGWPQASEDDAERSVHAALALVDAISGGHAPGGRSIEVRVAIASGLVVVRTVEDVERKGDIIGETPNLAARLQSLAEPNTVVIAPETWRLIGDMFDYADLGSHDLKGIANPVHLRQVLRSRLINSRFEGYRRQSLVPFVGRDRQISLLMECWVVSNAVSDRRCWSRENRVSANPDLFMNFGSASKSRLLFYATNVLCCIPQRLYIR